MKLIIYEIRKVLSQRVFILVLFLTLTVNGVILYNSQITKPDNYKLMYSSDYDEMIDEYSGYSFDKAVKTVEEKMLAYEILSKFKEFSSSSDAEYAQDLANEINDYKNKYPNAYSEAERLSKYADEDMRSKLFLEDINFQLKYLASYPAFKEQMSSRAQRQSKASIFNDAESFSYRNLFKTAEDYKSLKNLSLKIGKSSVLIETSSYNIGDYFVLAVLFLICIYMFNTEKDKGLYNLVKSTEKGRLSTILAKLCAFSLLSVIVSAAFIFSEYSINSLLYGMDTLDRNIQSIPEFRNCILNISVLQYYFLSVVTKTVSLLMIGMFFAFVFLCLSTPWEMYLCCGGALAVEYILYSFIPAEVSVNQLKYINVFYFICPDFLSKYLNINLFGYPVNILSVALTIGIGITLICITASSIVFLKKEQLRKSSRISNLYEKIKIRFLKTNGSTNLLKNELHKYLIQNKFALFFFILIALSIFSSFGTIPYNYSSRSDVIYREHMERLNGKISPAKLRYISDKEKDLKEIEKKLYSSDEYGKMADVISNILEDESEALNRVKSQKDRIRQLSKQNVNVEFIDENIYSNFISDSKREWNSFFLLCLLIMISVPIVFTGEYKSNVINLIRPTKNGKLHIYLNKIFLIFVSVLIMFVCVYIPYLIRFITSYGVRNLLKPICGIEQFSNSINISVVTAFIIENISYIFLALLTTSIIILIAVLLKNILLSFIMSSIILLVPGLLLKENSIIRAGNIFTSDWVFIFILMVAVELFLIIILLISAGLLFTGTKIRRD